MVAPRTGRPIAGMDIAVHLVKFVAAAMRVYAAVILIRALLSWLPEERRENELCRFLDAISEPVLRPLRRILPPLGGLDLSPLVIIFALEVARRLLLGTVR
jgi:YggT family protein